MNHPTLDLERSYWSRGLSRVAGVDEAGVGPLSGAVVAAAVILPIECESIAGVRDSKTLTREQRRELLGRIRRQAIAIGVGAASVCEIDRLNILAATHLAMWRALRRVAPYDLAIVDGRPVRDVDLGPHQTLVDADATSYSVACASIVAKETRDWLMAKLAVRHPAYGWERNAGYGTEEHRRALAQSGPSPYHRRSFAPVRACLAADGSGASEHI